MSKSHRIGGLACAPAEVQSRCRHGHDDLPRPLMPKKAMTMCGRRWQRRRFEFIKKQPLGFQISRSFQIIPDLCIFFSKSAGHYLKVTGGLGADLTLDAAGFTATCENAVWCTRRGGRRSFARLAIFRSFSSLVVQYSAAS